MNLKWTMWRGGARGAGEGEGGREGKGKADERGGDQGGRWRKKADAKRGRGACSRHRGSPSFSLAHAPDDP